MEASKPGFVLILFLNFFTKTKAFVLIKLLYNKKVYKISNS